MVLVARLYIIRHKMTYLVGTQIIMKVCIIHYLTQTYYMTCQAAYNASEKTHDDQYHFIRDIVWLYIDGVANELGDEYQLNTKSRKEIEDEMLRIDLEHRKAQLKIIDGGKK